MESLVAVYGWPRSRLKAPLKDASDGLTEPGGCWVLPFSHILKEPKERQLR